MSCKMNNEMKKARAKNPPGANHQIPPRSASRATNDDVQILRVQVAGLQMNQQRNLAVQQTLLGQILATQQRMELSLDSIIGDPIPPSLSKTGCLVSQSTHGNPAQSCNVAPYLPNTLSSLSHLEYTNSPAHKGCPRRISRKSSFLNRCFGMISLEHTGFRQPAQNCNDQTISQYASHSILITYFFPAWMIARYFCLLVRLSIHSGLQMSLRIPVMIARSSEIFIFAMTGNLKGIRNVFSKRLATPFDIDMLCGFTPLTV